MSAQGSSGMAVIIGVGICAAITIVTTIISIVLFSIGTSVYLDNKSYIQSNCLVTNMNTYNKESQTFYKWEVDLTLANKSIVEDIYITMKESAADKIGARDIKKTYDCYYSIKKDESITTFWVKPDNTVWITLFVFGGIFALPLIPCIPSTIWVITLFYKSYNYDYKDEERLNHVDSDQS